MKSSGKYFVRLEKRSSAEISKNIMKDSSLHIANMKFNGTVKSAIVVLVNTNIKKPTLRNYYLRYIIRNMYNNNAYLLHSKLIPKNYMGLEKVDGFFIVRLFKQRNKFKISSFTPIRVKSKKNIYGVYKIISGGQTGADQSGLKAGKFLGLYTGGTAPKCYMTESGVNFELEHYYGLQESSYSNYAVRTKTNIMDSDGTVIFGNIQSAGSAMTRRECIKNKKPCFVISNPKNIDQYKIDFRKWLITNNIHVLNVAGNRLSKNKKIFDQTFLFLANALSRSARIKKNADEMVKNNLNIEDFKELKKQELITILKKGKQNKKLMMMQYKDEQNK